MPWCVVLKHWHPMIGRDIHTQVLPAPPWTIPGMVYMTGSVLFGATLGTTTQKYFPTHMSAGLGMTMAKGTDVGPLIPHTGPLPHILLPIEVLLSSSKSHFGASSYMGKDNQGGTSAVACCALMVVNLNANCGIPLNLPVGLVPGLNTHVAHMTAGDYLAGVAQMVVEMLIQAAIGKIISRATSIQSIFPSAMKNAIASRLARSPAARRALNWAAGTGNNPNAMGPLVDGGIDAFVGFFVGGPAGADLATTSVGFSLYTPIDNALSEVWDAIPTYGLDTESISPPPAARPAESDSDTQDVADTTQEPDSGPYYLGPDASGR